MASSLPTWIYGGLECGCIRSLCQADQDRGHAGCIGAHKKKSYAILWLERLVNGKPVYGRGPMPCDRKRPPVEPVDAPPAPLSPEERAAIYLRVTDLEQQMSGLKKDYEERVAHIGAPEDWCDRSLLKDAREAYAYTNTLKAERDVLLTRVGIKPVPVVESPAPVVVPPTGGQALLPI